ncbi:hypothetical protein SISNIDRAFT_483955 [Sistotremastrum niveocremeum HHB9708]|uniref:Uncharacterized protein n=1 Tax=Sistotremastrum niveocremeum HHB9708 TaxID=1314777 RepID=A0A164WHR8_9AGAM|nr:hypothetical protein SISNIDRAFT_483955 [Sistotremastrum niveocremeum HHB9708]
MADSEINRHYAEGFPSKTYRKVQDRLQISSPNHDPLDDYSYPEIRAAAIWILTLVFRSPVTATGNDRQP